MKPNLLCKILKLHRKRVSWFCFLLSGRMSIEPLPLKKGLNTLQQRGLFLLRIIKQPETEKEFEAYYDLRWSILREPWQQPKGSEKDDLENESFHVMACDEKNKVVGVGRLHFNNKIEAQIRYMAVAAEYTKKGTGKLILETLEEKAKQ